MRNDFETVVMQALVDDAPSGSRLTGEPVPAPDAVARTAAPTR
jgi:hypothetical protein